MIFPEARVFADDHPRRSFEDLHGSVWARLQALPDRGAKSPAEIAIHGPMGVGKTVLLRRAYEHLFENQDAETPLLFSIPPVPFRPAFWARRFLMTAAWQWIAFERRDAQMARALSPPPPVLISLCRDARLEPMAETLEHFSKFENTPVENAFLIEWVFDAVTRAAERMNRRAVLWIDHPERAVWNEDGLECHLAGAVPPLPDDGPIRRVWALRRETSEDHALMPPSPPARELWEVAPLSPSAAAEFFDRRCREAGVDYDRHVLEDYLPLWGHIPQWLENFAVQTGSLPRPLITPDHFVQSYLEDISNGFTARALRDALRLTMPGAPCDLPRLAHAAHAALRWEDRESTFLQPAETAEETGALRRLARVGLAVYQQGGWRPSRVPILEDFLRLFISRLLPGENPLRDEVALKRRRLMETPRRINRQQLERKIRHMELLMHTFRGQSVPAELFRRHLDRAAWAASGPASEAVGTQAETLASLVAGNEERIRVPWCIGAFAYDAPLPGQRGKPATVSTVAASCFENPECLPSEETLWVAHLCGATVVTTEELNQMERLNRRIAREFRVGRVIGWLITDGSLSREALEQIRTLRFHVSSWRDCEILGELLMRGVRPRESGTENAEDEASAPPPSAKAGARIVSAARTAEKRTAEVLLSPHSEMELVAAGVVEQVAGACGFEAAAIAQMRMATLEACLNALEHSRNPEKRVRLRVEGDAAKCVIIVENEGAVFDPQALEEPVLEKKMNAPYKRGWGLMLMRKFMDRVAFEPCEGGTRLRMEKNNPAASAQPANKAAATEN